MAKSAKQGRDKYGRFAKATKGTKQARDQHGRFAPKTQKTQTYEIPVYYFVIGV